MSDKPTGPGDDGGIGVLADGKLNVIPPDKLAEHYAQMRRELIEEGYAPEGEPENK